MNQSASQLMNKPPSGLREQSMPPLTEILEGCSKLTHQCLSTAERILQALGIGSPDANCAPSNFGPGLPAQAAQTATNLSELTGKLERVASALGA